MADMPVIRPGLYRHYKGGLYAVPGVVLIDEKTGKPQVLYLSLSERVWIGRDYDEFASGVKLHLEPDERDSAKTGRSVWRLGTEKRFERVTLRHLRSVAYLRAIARQLFGVWS